MMKQIRVPLGRGGSGVKEEGIGIKRGQDETFRVVNILIMVMISQVYTCVKTYRIVHFLNVEVIVCQLYSIPQ